LKLAYGLFHKSPKPKQMAQEQTQVSDIVPFFVENTLADNDKANKTREEVLKVICNPPQEFLNDAIHGEKWRTVHQEWKNAEQIIAKDSGILSYNETKTKMRGGRGYNYDADLMYYYESLIKATKKIELKKGGSNIDDQPQFLSLMVKFGMFSETYDIFYYKNYLLKYIACDPIITQAVPPLEKYIKNLYSTNYSINPFIAQIKERELFFKDEKNKVVNDSITDYLTQFGHTIDIPSFSEKVKSSQTDKIYLLWSNRKFNIDKMTNEEMTGMTFHSIKGGNVIQLNSGNTTYSLLLRWRNHKGILMPAWQVSLKRLVRVL